VHANECTSMIGSSRWQAGHRRIRSAQSPTDFVLSVGCRSYGAPLCFCRRPRAFEPPLPVPSGDPVQGVSTRRIVADTALVFSVGAPRSRTVSAPVTRRAGSLGRSRARKKWSRSIRLTGREEAPSRPLLGAAAVRFARRRPDALHARNNKNKLPSGATGVPRETISKEARHHSLAAPSGVDRRCLQRASAAPPR
jgi:hypothetical protein